MGVLKSPKAPQAERQFRVGSQVYFVFGQEYLKATIIEDRGAIGRGGRCLYRVEAPMGVDEPPIIGEFSADDLQPA